MEMKYFLVEVNYFWVVIKVGDYLLEFLNEIVFVGCLNVGKLLLINVFFNCKKFVCMLNILGVICVF